MAVRDPRSKPRMSGPGWTLVDVSSYPGTPGTHDVGALLGATSVQLLLVVLRAADRWTTPAGIQDGLATLLHRAGRLRVELADGSTKRLDESTPLLSIPKPVVSVTNVGLGLAEVLLIAPTGGSGHSDE